MNDDRIWTGRRVLRQYVTTDLRPVEARLLEEHRDAFAGRVLELGCGAGRVTGHLAAAASHVDAIDVSEDMIEAARRKLPQVSFHRLSMTELAGFETGAFDAVFGSFNVIDVLDDAGRRAVLDELRRVLVPGGTLVFSSHNRDFAPLVRMPWQLPTHRPLATLNAAAHLPLRVVNRARLKRREVQTEDHALLADPAHDWSLLLYYTRPADQRRQLAEHGFEALECLALDGSPVDWDAPPAEVPELHYVARSAASR